MGGVALARVVRRLAVDARAPLDLVLRLLVRDHVHEARRATANFHFKNIC